jgi:thioesterase domain-containing protein
MHSGEPEHGPPLFLVAGMFGNVLNLRHLAHLVGQEQPIYGVQARGLFGDHQPHESFEAMARDYLAEIRQIQPHGPYLLGGFSGGGIAAWEMTRQLLDDGERVALLALLDTRLPSNPELTRREKAEMHLENLRREGPGYVAKWAKRRMRWELEQRRHRDVGEPEPGRFHDRRIEEAFLRALGRYQVPRLQDVPVVLFRPELQPAYRFGSGRQISADRTVLLEDNGWGAFCDGLRVRVVPGDHDSMVLEPNVRVLANRLSDLARAARHRGEARMGATGS